MALMLYAHSRRAARRDGAGRYVPLSEQPTALWDGAAIEEAERLLSAASASRAPGRFQLEAAVQSVHAARRLGGTTDWQAIVQLYDALFALTGSPVVAVNRAVAVSHTQRARGGARAPRGGRGPPRRLRALLGGESRPLRPDRRPRRGAPRLRLAIGLQTDPAARAFLVERIAALAKAL